MSKTLVVLRASHPDKIRNAYKDSDGYWIDLHYGWQLSGTHTVHEWNVRDLKDSFRTVEPCTCRECQTQGAEWEDIDLDTGKLIIRKRGEVK